MEMNAVILETAAEKGNKGEKDEIASIRELFEKRHDNEFCKSKFSDHCGEGGIEVISPNTHLAYTSVKEIIKAKSTSKADIIVRYNNANGQTKCWNISYKSLTGAPPSIINHTPRSAKVFQAFGDLHHHVSGLDILSKEYIEKRTQSLFKEDVKIGMFDTYKNDEQVRQSMLHVVCYFVFKGTGRKKSVHECNAILIKNRDGSHRFTTYETDDEKLEYIRSIIEQCVISFRSKNMPRLSSNACLPWAYMSDTGKACGSIHIRLAHK